MSTAKPIITEVTTCRSCGGAHLVSVFDLGSQPFANSLLKAPDAPEGAYPLHIVRCEDCSLVQLRHTADPAALFSHYVWVTGTSSTARAHADQFCADALARLPEGTKPRYVLEVASNDGTFLKPFQARGIDVLGVDPAANIVARANADGIPSRCAFFGEAEAAAIIAERGNPSLVIARNVLPHVESPRDLVAGIAKLAGDDGLAVIEFHDGREIVDGLHYDSIYHEHLCYFTIQTMSALLGAFGLHIIDVGISPISGGSLIVYAQKGVKAVEGRLKDQIERDRREHVNDRATWETFGTTSTRHAARLKALIEAELTAGRTVVGYGASARSSTLLNFAGIDHRHLVAIADQNPLKQGLFTAGTHIPILSPTDAFAKHPDTVLMLAWNFRAEIDGVLRDQLGFKGKVICPLPNDTVDYVIG